MNIYEAWDRAEAAREDQLDELIRQDETDELYGLGRSFFEDEEQYR